MLLSELINRANEIYDKDGDIPVYICVHYNKKCTECGQSESHNKSGPAEYIFRSGLTTEIPKVFWIDGGKK